MSAPVSESAASGIVWDLSALFSSTEDPKIAETWKKCNDLADAFASKYRGKVGELDATALGQAIRELELIVNEASKAPGYAGLLFAADTSDAKLGAFYQAQAEESSALRVKVMFFDLELQKISDERMETLLADPALENYRHYVGVIRTYSPYMLSETEEVLLEEVSNTGSRAWVRLHDEVLSNHVFPFVNPESGETEELSQEEILDKLRHKNRDVRIAAADGFSKGLAELNRVITFTYNTLLADKKLEDRLRKFEFAEQSRHLANELDKETVDIVTNLCEKRYDLVERFYKVKKSILGLEELTHVDRYAPLAEAEERVSWQNAREMVCSSFSDFHPELGARGEEFFDKNWIDAESRKGKSGGAFCSYNTPDTHPVIFMSYLGKLGDVMTLAHELGHGVHSSFSRKQTQFNYHGTLPLAELASIFGEMLVFEKITATASESDQLALYAEKIEGIFASVHRQAAMFRFEKKCHEHRRTKGELSSEEFGEYWQAEMQQMFGDAVNLGDQHKMWWSYVGHFFFAPFYVYAYSFGELLTLSLYAKAKQEGPDFAAKYVQVLELGGSLTPDELMAIVGVDLHSQEFWEGGFAAIEKLVDKFEELWAKQSA